MNFINKRLIKFQMTSKDKQAVYDLFESKGCKIINMTIKSENIEYICKCGEKKLKLYKDFIKRGCKTCNNKKLKEKPDYEYIDDSGEIWKPVVGGWISNLGKAKNSLEKELTLCPTKFRYHIGGKNQYVTRLLAEAFQIENYEKLNDKKYIVIKINDDDDGFTVDNIKIILQGEKLSTNLPRQSEIFEEKSWWAIDKFKDIESKIISELPNHILYRNGEVWNSTRFLTFSKINNKYLTLNTTGKTYKVHRLICFAFNPIEGKNILSDYDRIQVNHKDGNTLNNNANNLEWSSGSENMYHSNTTGLNKKVRNVLQFTLKGEFIKEYISIADASRESKEPEHRIRVIAQGKKNSKAEFIWKFKNEKETEDYSSKYSSTSSNIQIPYNKIEKNNTENYEFIFEDDE